MVILGPPAAGKGTQAVVLARDLQVPHLATGDMFRQAIAQKTPAGQQAAALLERGDLVPDGVVFQMVRDRLDEPDCRNGFLFDGFPRNLAQAGWLTVELKRRSEPLDRVLALEVPDDVVIQRVSGRRTCQKCETVFHLDAAPPRKPGVCDRCGGTLYQRKDDSPEAATRRLQVYRDATLPLLRYYGDRNLLTVVKGTGAAREVSATVREALA